MVIVMKVITKFIKGKLFNCQIYLNILKVMNMIKLKILLSIHNYMFFNDIYL